ncbi:hypothetical protein llap_16126 [Limosa lapponica baueri]|uniref:Uncharacterized protein n=1 Tax=Limosa lapponica baueri TaxID=1758121 RepID=A0A2I0TID5_LIMLA|nr:hypothetical protein llap_16126 [Limosa lapponica baueri]
MVRVGRDLKDHRVPAPSSLALNTSRDGASTASLGNLFQCLTTLPTSECFLQKDLDQICDEQDVHIDELNVHVSEQEKAAEEMAL